MPASGKLNGKVAIITGAGRGIGRAIALALSESGADVVLASRTLSEIEETQRLVRAKGRSALAVPTDVSDWGSVQDLVKRAIDEYGNIHILVNNAGVQGAIGPLVENDPDLWVQTIQVNLTGTFYCCKAVLPYMITQQYGRIINLSGGGATSPRVNYSAYGVSKAAVVRLTETLAEEVRDFGIQVNAIAPGAVNTRMLEETLAAGGTAGEKARAEAQRQLETGGAPPGLAAELVLFLASDASAGLTGKLIAAPYDPWREWEGKGDELNATPMYTLRRLDPFTIKPLIGKLE